MNNLLPSSIVMHQKYDLKGSTYKRKVSDTSQYANLGIIVTFSFRFRRQKPKDKNDRPHSKIWTSWNIIRREF